MASAPRKDRREGSLFRLACESRPRSGERRFYKGPPFFLGDVANAWQAAIAASDAVMYIDAQGEQQPGPWRAGYSRVRLEKVTPKHIDGKFHSYCLLLSWANARAADPGRRDFKSDVIEVMQLGVDGGLEYGAHLVIGDISKDQHVNTSRCVLESMPGLGRERIIGLLEDLAERHMDETVRPEWTVVQKKGPPLNVIGRLKLSSHAEKSDNLKQLIEDDGRVIGVTFMRAPASNQLTDEFPDQLEPEEFVLHAKVKRTATSLRSATGIIKAAAEFARKKGWRMKTELAQGEGVEARHFSRPFDLEHTNLDEQKYARRHPLTIATSLPQCYETINDDVNKALCQILDQQDLWT